MGKTIETGAVDQPPARIKDDGKCIACGEYVEEDEDHECNGEE